MASGGPSESQGAPFMFHGSYSEPRPKRRPPRYGGSLDTELSLNTELRRAEEQISQQSLPNNLEWSLSASAQASGGAKEKSGNRREKKSKAKHFEQVKLKEGAGSIGSPPPRQHHTPATIPRTRLPPGTPLAERVAMQRVRQHLLFDDEDQEQKVKGKSSHGGGNQGHQENTKNPSAANNERVVPPSQRGAGSMNILLPGRETNVTEPGISGAPAQDSETAAERDVETGQVLERLRQVRDFLKQATSMFVALQTTGNQSGQTTQDLDQASKLARLIKHLKQQEKAYLDLLQRTIAVHDDSTLDNSPSLSMQSLTEEEKSDAGESSSIRDEELQGLRTQHALLRKMLDQQKQLKELQSRQASLLALQQDAERRLASAEEEVVEPGLPASENRASATVASRAGASSAGGTAGDRNRRDTETSGGSQGAAAQASGGENAGDGQLFTPEQLALLNLLRKHKEKWRAADGEAEKDEDEKLNQRRVKNQTSRNSGGPSQLTEPEPVINADNEAVEMPVTTDNSPSEDYTASDAEPTINNFRNGGNNKKQTSSFCFITQEAALALADATQERLELENKLMALQAKKEQMDALLGQLQALRAAQLNKGMLAKESKDGTQGQGPSVNESRQEDDEPPLATTSQKLDDDSILEALEVHEKLKKLQEVRDRLSQLRELLGYYQPPNVESEGTTQESSRRESVTASVDTTERESGQEEGEDGAVGDSAVHPTAEIDWILNAGIHDPELSRRLRELQAARQRVGNLKQTNETGQASSSRANNESARRPSVQTQTTGDESDAGTQTDTDAEGSVTSGASSSLNALVWQDDPVFQEKVEKLNSAKKKLKQLQELVKKVNQFPDQLPILPMELAELSFDDNEDEDEEGESDDNDSSTEEAEQEPVEGVGAAEGDGDDDDAITLSEGELSENKDERIQERDQEAAYQRQLQKQRNELERLLEERHKLLRVQQELTRISEQEEQLQNKRSTTTQTPFYGSELRQARSNKSYSVDSSEPVGGRAPAAPGSNTLLWSELRRQREMHEEKLKKRKQRFVFEKRKKAGLDDLSEGGTYSVRSGRSGDVDEGFGVSMMSADITTATWGGSTQPSSTQNDSAVSADGSDVENRGEIAVEVEDEYRDGILQAEEEEEQDAFTGEPDCMFSSRRGAQRLRYEDSREPGAPRISGKKRKLNGRALASGIRKRDRERGLTFENWPRPTFSDRSSRNRVRLENFSPSDQLTSNPEQEEFRAERRMWGEQCKQLHQEIGNLTRLCNSLLSDHQTLVSTIINRSSSAVPVNHPPAGASNPFSQYQQRQQNAYEGIQQYFDQQRYLMQQQQLMQNLTQCYQQMQQQQQDMANLQQHFQQLFSFNPMANSVNVSPQPPFGSRPQTTTPLVPPGVTGNLPPSLFPSFQGLPSRPLVSTEYPQTTAVPTSGSPPFQIHLRPETSPATVTVSPNSRRVPSENFNVNFGAPSADMTSQGIPSVGLDTSDVCHRFGRHPMEPASQPASVGLTSPANSTAVPAVSGIITGNGTYNPNLYTETTVQPTLSSAVEQLPSAQEVVGRTFPTPLRASAVASLAQKAGQKTPHERTAAIKRDIESVETSSAVSGVSSVAGEDKKTTSEAGSEFSLFEALRDSIYSEVATLISLNESRPHFLIELFRELQLLTSDYLRQRALYALQDLVTRFLTEDSLAAGPSGPLVSQLSSHLGTQSNVKAWVGSVSEHTPSESVETSENESEARDAAVEAQTVTEGIYDYIENVESGSTLSTPTSSQAGENPFASDGLGDTVIHLDKALSKMREYERLKAEGKIDLGASPPSATKVRTAGAVNIKDDVTTSSAGDVGSESSMSDVQYPRIDTQALDHQIKAIMSEVIPYLNDHMEDTCSPQLLGYVKDLVLSRLQVNEDKEFGRFFHKQLESILQDSLAKFVTQQMKDCGEDMLVDMSEILFNELAFFRLMQDLDSTGGPSRRAFWRQGYESTSDADTGTGQEREKEGDGEEAEDKEQEPGDSAAEGVEGSAGRDANGEEDGDDEEEEDEVDETSSSGSESGEDSDAEDEGADDEQEAEELPLPQAQIEAEEEALGKDRDDDMATTFEERQLSMSEKSSVESQQYVKVELSVSESKPFTSAGSGEEDGNESFDDSEARRRLEDYEGGTAASAAASDRRPEVAARGGAGNSLEPASDSADENGAPQDEQVQAAAAEGHLHNGQVNSQEEIEVSIDDLPTKLTGLTEADLQARMAAEQSRNEGAAAVLVDMGGAQELAGDPNALREPDGGEAPVNGLVESE